MPSKTETLMSRARWSHLGKQLIPLEANCGWPVPIRREGRLYVKLVFYTPRRRRGTGPRGARALLSPPFATLTLDWKTERPVEYVDLRYHRPWPAEEERTFEAAVSRNEYVAHTDNLFALYDQLFGYLEEGSEPSAQWMTDFSQLLNALMEPGLVAYYRAIAPKFCERFLASPVATATVPVKT